MKTCFALVALFLISILTYSQQQKNSNLSPAVVARDYTTHLEANELEPLTIPFNRVEVRDVRPDTTKLGYFKGNLAFYKFTADSSFNNFYPSLLTSKHADSNYTLCVFIRNCWISVFDTTIATSSSVLPFTQISLECEFFLRSAGGYHPLYRFDSTVVFKGVSGSSSVKMLEKLLTASSQKLYTIDHRQKIKKQLPAEMIAERYDPSVFKVNQQMKVGVYITFEDYKNNKPTYTDFKVDQDDLADVLSVKDNSGQSFVLREAWAYYDGKMTFIKMGYNYFPVFSEGNTLNFFATARTKKNKGYAYAPLPRGSGSFTGTSPAVLMIAVIADNIHKTQKLGKLRPYQLNMATGEIY